MEQRSSSTDDRDTFTAVSADMEPYRNERRSIKSASRRHLQPSVLVKHQLVRSPNKERKSISFEKEYKSLGRHKKESKSSHEVKQPLNLPDSENIPKHYVLHSKIDEFKERGINQVYKSSPDEKAQEYITSSGPEGLSVQLFPHQLSGLKFLEQRENLPGEYKGGLLCDDMGLGKTVQMISLMLLRAATKPYTKSNLIVCPLSLLNQWKSEIENKAPKLKVYIFHGKQKDIKSEELTKYDAVLTTYSTLSQQYILGDNSILHCIKWWRVILDEAHNIKNKKAKQSVATFNLNGSRRWCLTGTPIQNNLTELHSLFIFIKVSKLSNDEHWRRLVSDALKKHDIDIAVKTLKTELQYLMLRRTKDILRIQSNLFLPRKTETNIMIKFSQFEKQLYENLSRIIASRLYGKSITSSVSDNTKFKLKKGILKIDSKSYVSAFVMLLRLRQLCCSWELLLEKVEKTDDELCLSEGLLKTMKPHTADDVDQLSKSLEKLSVDSKICCICSNSLEKGDNGSMCAPCQNSLDLKSPKSEQLSFVLAKFKALMDILSKDKERKTIIFSQFSSLFDILVPFLRRQGYSPLVFTGSMNLESRNHTLLEAKEDSRKTVLLCSLKCASVGLNLTFASRVIILDPYWNPSIQEQAIDRVYRMGQANPVDVYIVTIENSVEQKILKLQARKKDLASIITSDRLDNKGIKNPNHLSQRELLQLLGMESFQ
ncbi:uncharacterized protein PRCAT00000569001 [Priceomyces carsonii]|uniref:uncharacterized protein n=1 Tax=Priceomyces carsonii TaxID=28549 RepID=UPI002ED7B201|nr:unnamed protein product [Priceomyces carsonii]